MNQTFAKYSTSTAFVVQLSKNQCHALLMTHMAHGDKEDVARVICPTIAVGTLKGLEARGLVFWNRNERGQASGFGGLTKAGYLMADLLIEAGLNTENTRTVSVLRRL